MNRETPSAVAITVKKRDTKTPPETGKPKASSESSRRYREAVEEFLAQRDDFSKRGGNISAVLPQGSPGPLKPEDSELDEE